MFNKIIAVILSIFSLFSSLIFDSTNNYVFEIDTSEKGDVIGNKVSNINVWDMGTQFYESNATDEDNIYDFVEYVQLMQCTGGNEQRDLFKNPFDKSVLDDYDFERLIKNCRGILESGAKPCLKLGNVPIKLSEQFSVNGMENNLYPPADYNQYYIYMCAVAQALVDEFGKEEVLSWHFTVFTEYENADWFECGTPEETEEAFFKIYDYTVQALIDTIGEDVYVGAHSMTVTEGYWDEADFIKHCGIGTNYATGKTGTRVCFLSASYYESEPGKVGKRKTLKETVGYLQKYAEKYGLGDIDFGVDEGRILCASSGKNDNQLLSRTVGYTYQAAYDARLCKVMIDNDIDYFSMWTYKSDGQNNGIPTVSYHVAKLISEFANAVKVKVKKVMSGLIPGAEVEASAGFDKETNTLHIMAYNYKNDINYSREADVKLKINASEFKDGEVTVIQYLINDDCNWFDEWCKDKEEFGITNECFNWSPDCPNIGSNIIDSKTREIYNQNKDKYYECAKLTPIVTTATVKDGKLELDTTLGGNNVVFYEITQ